jgi:hypothetical protein
LGKNQNQKPFFGQLVFLAPLDTPHTGETAYLVRVGQAQTAGRGAPTHSLAVLLSVSAPLCLLSNADCDAQTAECVGVLGWVAIG